MKTTSILVVLLTLNASCGVDTKPFPESTRRSHVIEFVGVKNFSKNSLSVKAPNFQIKEGVIENWTEGGGVESGSLILPGPFPYSLDLKLDYNGKTYTKKVTAPDNMVNRPALYKAAWNLETDAISFSYSSYEWRSHDIEYEAHFGKSGHIDELTSETNDRKARIVYRYRNNSGIPYLHLVAIIPKNGTMYWVRYTDKGSPTEIEIDPTRSDFPIKLFLDEKSRKPIKAMQKTTRRGDYTKEVPITEELQSKADEALSTKPPEVNWNHILKKAGLTLEIDKNASNKAAHPSR